MRVMSSQRLAVGARLATAALCVSIVSCQTPWDVMATWKKGALLTVRANRNISKTANTQARESKNTIASIKNTVKDVGGNALKHSLQAVLDECTGILHEKLDAFDRIPLIKSAELLANETFTAVGSEPGVAASMPEPENERQARLQKMSANYSDTVIVSQGYKLLTPAEDLKLIGDLGLDGAFDINISYQYDLVGVGTAGSAKGVAVLTVTAYCNNGEKIVPCTFTYSGTSDGKTDVKSGGFFDEAEMDKLLVDAFRKAVDEFIANVTENIDKAKAKAAEAAAA
jgi:hypothetical protein